MTKDIPLMFEKIAIQLIDTKIEVLIISALFITLPANMVLSITAAAYTKFGKRYSINLFEATSEKG